MPSISGWSKKDVEALMNLINLSYEINGYGYVVSQSIDANTIITEDMMLIIELKDTYIKEVEEETKKTTE